MDCLLHIGAPKKPSHGVLQLLIFDHTCDFPSEKFKSLSTLEAQLFKNQKFLWLHHESLISAHSYRWINHQNQGNELQIKALSSFSFVHFQGTLEQQLQRLKQYQAAVISYKPNMDELEKHNQASEFCLKTACD